MEGVIIAAGAGSRFGAKTRDVPKPLLKIKNKSLIMWVMDSLITGGITEIVIVVGYLGDMIIKDLGKEYSGVKIDYVINKDWKLGNLTSLYSAKSKIKEDFILSMSDHLFDPTIINDLINKENETTVLLAVDRKYQQVDDDMKVLVNNEDFIENIGKDIVGNFVDIGLFKMKPKIFEYAEKVIHTGKHQLYLAVKEAAKNNDARVMDINRRFWIDVDTLEELNSYYVQNFKKFIETGKWD